MLIKKAGYIPTGSPKLDLSLQGGYLKGSIVELIGSYSSAKTLLALSSLKFIDCLCYIDFEFCIDRSYIRDRMKIPLSKLVVVRPKPNEVADCIISASYHSPVIVFDSTAVPTDLQTRISDIKSRIITNNSTLILLSQIRNNISNNDEYSTGGYQLKSWCDDRIRLLRLNAIKEGYRNIGRQLGVYILKSRRAIKRYFIIYDMVDDGLGYELEMVDLLLEKGFAIRSGKFIWYNNKAYNGKLDFYRMLRYDEEMKSDAMERIRDGIRQYGNIFERSRKT